MQLKSSHRHQRHTDAAEPAVEYHFGFRRTFERPLSEERILSRPESLSSTTTQPVSARWWGAAVLMTWVFWPSLWMGGGLVGGDVYSYSLPQKTYLADALQSGDVPLWNSLTGHGYPVLGESQTGVLYPLHLLVYSIFDVGTGWNVVLLVHYIAAFVAMAWCVRGFGVVGSGSLLAATVYVYGWFPPRAFLDWAILGGVYLPLSIGAAERFFQTGRFRYAALLSASVALQLLGGHYQLAFLTWLLGAAFFLFRWRQTSWRSLLAPAIAFLLGVALAAPQLAASWELKARSQRATVGVDHDPAYGHIPPGYLTQWVAPWFWYDAGLDLDAALQRMPLGQISAGTNKVEAHCYFGLAPALLLIAGGILAVRRRAATVNDGFWMLVIVASLAYATGWLMPLLQGLPGFNYFRGPGRASILATFAVAMLVGRLFEAWLRQLSSTGARRAVAVGMFVVTIADLWFMPTTVSYATVVTHPPIAFRNDSPIRKLLLQEPGPVRLYAPGANVPNLLGVASTPVYLGFGPREYFSSEFTIPETDPPDFHAFTPARLQWLHDAGVTHILSFEPLERRGWPVDLLWANVDPLLNRAWARPEPVFLYQLREAPGRVRWDAGGSGPMRIEDYSAHRVRIHVEAITAGNLILTDLADPGWFVTVDGKAAAAHRRGMFRSVAVSTGVHEVVWSFRPRSVYWGTAVAAGALMLFVVSAWCYRRQW